MNLTKSFVIAVLLDTKNTKDSGFMAMSKQVALRARDIGSRVLTLAGHPAHIWLDDMLADEGVCVTYFSPAANEAEHREVYLLPKPGIQDVVVYTGAGQMGAIHNMLNTATRLLVSGESEIIWVAVEYAVSRRLPVQWISDLTKEEILEEAYRRGAISLSNQDLLHIVSGGVKY